MPPVKSLHLPRVSPKLGSGLPIVADKVSPNLSGSTTNISIRALNFLSPACLPIPPSRHLRKKHRGRCLISWSERRGSNPRPRPWQGRALPAELLSHYNSPLYRRIVDAKLGNFRNLSSADLKKSTEVFSSILLKTDSEPVRHESK
jgi:hypothetical protein